MLPAVSTSAWRSSTWTVGLCRKKTSSPPRGDLPKETGLLLSCWHFLQSHWQGTFPSENLSSWPNSCRTDIHPSRMRQARFSPSFVTKSGQRNKPKENLSHLTEGLLSKTQLCVFTRNRVLKRKHGSVESSMQLPGWGKSKISSPPSSAKTKHWQGRHLECHWLFLSWSLQCRWRSLSQHEGWKPWYPAVRGRVHPVYSPVTTLGLLVSPPEHVALEASGFTTPSRNHAASTAEYDLVLLLSGRWASERGLATYDLGGKEPGERRRTWLVCCLMEWEWIGQHSR